MNRCIFFLYVFSTKSPKHFKQHLDLLLIAHYVSRYLENEVKLQNLFSKNHFISVLVPFSMRQENRNLIPIQEEGDLSFPSPAHG